MARRGPRGFGHLATGVPVTPEPIGAGMAHSLALFNVIELSGLGTGGGLAHFGMRGDPATTWEGWTATPQSLQGQIQMGKTRGVSVQDYPALPNDQAPAAVVSWLPDWTAGLAEGS